MRPLELLVALVLLFPWMPLKRKDKVLLFYWSASMAVVMILHLLIDHPRWQMVPIYAALLTQWGSTYLGVKQRTMASSRIDQGSNKIPINFRVMVNLLRAALNLGTATFTTVGLLCSIFLPVCELPAPSGNYKVGTTNGELIDSNRRERFAGAGVRRCPFQVWYPAGEPLSGAIAPYMQASGDWQHASAAGLWMLGYNHYPLIKTHSLLNASVSSGQTRCPVIFFSHGLMGLRGQNTIQMEELASRGFIVISLEHPHDAAFAIFPDGHIVAAQTMTGPVSAQAELVDWDNDLETRIEDLLSLHHCLQDICTPAPSVHHEQSQVRIENCPILENLASHMDIAKCGIFGHSLGGAAAIRLCGTATSPFRAGVCLDARDGQTTELRRPFMFLEADRGKDHFGNNALIDHSPSVDAYYVKFLNGGHLTFSDMPLLNRFRITFLDQEFGKIPQLEAEHIINRYLDWFFDAYLIGNKEHTIAPIDQFSWTQVVVHKASPETALDKAKSRPVYNGK